MSVQCAQAQENRWRLRGVLKGLQDRRTVEVGLTDAGRASFAEAERTAGTWLRPNTPAQLSD